MKNDMSKNLLGKQVETIDISSFVQDDDTPVDEPQPSHAEPVSEEPERPSHRARRKENQKNGKELPIGGKRTCILVQKTVLDLLSKIKFAYRLSGKGSPSNSTLIEEALSLLTESLPKEVRDEFIRLFGK